MVQQASLDIIQYMPCDDVRNHVGICAGVGRPPPTSLIQRTHFPGSGVHTVAAEHALGVL